MFKTRNSLSFLGGLLLLWMCCADQSHAQSTPEFALREKDTVLFLGDSNTFADDYIKYLDAYLFTRFPDRHFNLVNRGMPSETVAGTSEPTHLPPRPDLHTRLSSVLSSVKPNSIVACYGMNDGIYLPPNPEVFTKYQAGIRRMLQRINDETENVRVTVMTPPPFDARPFSNKPETNPADYRRPASNYDETLQQFSEWLRTLQSGELQFISIHSEINQHIQARREKQPSFILSGDGIHPNSTGHMLIAMEILEAWNAPSLISEAKFDWTEIQSASSNPRIIKKDSDALIFDWGLPLPMPVDPTWDPASVQLERVAERMNHIRLQIGDLPEGNYRLTVDRAILAQFTKAELEKGVNIGALTLFPGGIKSQEVLKLVKQRRQILLEHWVKNDPHPRLADMHKTSTATLEQAEVIEKKIRELCQSQIYRFEILKMN